MNDLEEFTENISLEHYAECFGVDKLSNDIFPLDYTLIDKEQQKDPTLLKALKANLYTIKAFCGGDDKSIELICHNDKIVIPTSLRQRVVEWYHTYLLQPGLNRTEESICQHLAWPNL